MKTLLAGIALIVVLGVGGFLYRTTVERQGGPVACPADARLCPDGTALGRTGPSCTFPSCPPPNTAVGSLGIEFALPSGYVVAEVSDGDSVVAYARGGVTGVTSDSEIAIRRYSITGSSTPIDVIRATAIQDASGLPAPVTAFSSITIGTHRFTVVQIGRFEGIVATAYYLARSGDVLRFDAIDRGVANWTEPNLVVSELPAHKDLRALLSTLQGN